MRAVMAVSLVAVTNVLASPPCTDYSTSPVPASQLPSFFSQQNVTHIETLLEKDSIDRLLSQYAYIIDGRAYDDLSGIFNANATAVYPSSPGVLNGVEAIKTSIAGMLAQFSGTQHLLGSKDIRLCGKQKAISVAYFRAAHFSSQNATNAAPDIVDDSDVIYGYGQYQDSWEKHDGLWKIVHRNQVFMVSLRKSQKSAFLELT